MIRTYSVNIGRREIPRDRLTTEAHLRLIGRRRVFRVVSHAMAALNPGKRGLKEYFFTGKSGK